MGKCGHWKPKLKATCGKPAITPFAYKGALCRFHLRSRKQEIVAEFIKIQRILKADAEKTYQ